MHQLIRNYRAHLRKRGLSRLTQIGYSADLQQMVAYLRGVLDRPQIGPADLSSDLLQEWIFSFRPRTALRKLQALRGFTCYLHRKGHLGADPCLDVSLPKQPPKPLPKFLSIDQALRLCKAPMTQGAPTRFRSYSIMVLRDAAILHVLYASGLRACEASRLDVADLQFDTPRRGKVTIFVRNGKGGFQRYVVCGRRTKLALQAYLARRKELGGADGPALFLSVDGAGRLGRCGISAVVKSWAKKLGFHAYAHLLRHSCGAHLTWAEVALRAIQAHLGHASPVTTAWYAHVDLMYLEKATRRHPLG